MCLLFFVFVTQTLVWIPFRETCFLSFAMPLYKCLLHVDSVRNRKWNFIIYEHGYIDTPKMREFGIQM